MRRKALAALARRYPEDYRKIYDSIKAGKPLDEVTVGEWATQWLDMQVRKLRPGTFVAHRSAVTKWILPTIGDKPLAGLQPSDLREVHTIAEDAGLADSTVERIAMVAKLLISDAYDEGHDVPERTLRTKRLGGIGPANRQAIPVDQARKILDVAMSRPDASRWVAALLQGMRPGEALGLRWSNVDLNVGTMTVEWQLKNLPYNEGRVRSSGFRVPRGFEAIHLVQSYHLVRPKTASGVRVVPLVPWLRTELAAWAAIAPESPYGLVWSDNGKPKSQADDREQWYQMCEQADVWLENPDGSKRRPLLYEARHTAATLLMASGVDETTLTAIVGHSKITSTKAYLHTDETRKLEALLSVGEQLGLAS